MSNNSVPKSPIVWPGSGTSTQLASAAGTPINVSPSVSLTGGTLNLVGSLYGTYASRPSAGIAGRIYTPSDGPISFFDDGTSWRPILPGAGLGRQPPLASTFGTTISPVSNGSTLTDSTGTLVIDTPVGASISENSNMGWVTTKAAAQTITMFIECMYTQSSGTADYSMGLVFRNSTNSPYKMATFMQQNAAGWSFFYYNTPPTSTTVTGTSGFPSIGSLVGLRMIDEGGSGNIICQLSSDNVNWVTTITVGRTVPFGGASADQWGLFVRPYNARGTTRIVSLEVT